MISFPSSRGNDHSKGNDINIGAVNNSKNNNNIGYSGNSAVSSQPNFKFDKPTLKSVNIPYYFQGENEDSIALQIKSMFYVYHRFKISRLQPFLKYNDMNDQMDFDYFYPTYDMQPNHMKKSTEKVILNDKLDTIYNVHHFKSQLLNDPYRVLFDYVKNKFRSLLIISDYPNDISDVPTLYPSSYRFLVLKPNDPVDRYIEVLVRQSGIYSEHKVSRSKRVELLLKIISKQRKISNPDNEEDFEFSRDDRSNIIRLYVQRLALHVQIHRLFKATLKSKERERKNNLHRFTHEKNIQSYKSLTSERSRLHLIPGSSPIKGGNNDAITIMDINDSCVNNSTDNLYYSDTADSQASSSTSSINFTKLFTHEEKEVFYEQSKMAVRIRIERERSSLLF